MLITLAPVFLSPACSGNDVKLVDGFSGSDGRVEVCVNGEWSGICDYEWDVNDALVICRQYGLATASETFIKINLVTTE